IDVSQVELGYKLSRDNYFLYATAFSNNTKGQPFCDIGASTCARLETKAIGVELDGKLFIGSFTLDLNATVQEPEIDNGPLKGNQVLRQPTHMMRLTPSYNFTLGNNIDTSLYATYSVISDRYGDNDNTN